jgi:hypothetical protein
MISDELTDGLSKIYVDIIRHNFPLPLPRFLRIVPIPPILKLSHSHVAYHPEPHAYGLAQPDTWWQHQRSFKIE